jgi:hypothetical protein
LYNLDFIIQERKSLVSAESIIHEIETHYRIGEPVTKSGFSIYPLISDLDTPIIGLDEADELGVAWVQESKDESVELLEAINKGEIPVLIPYLTQVQGGKQDRTVFEPIIIPSKRGESNPLNIPARCIEQSRWGYSSSTGEATSQRFKSARTRMGSQMSFSVSKRSDQGAVWDNIESARAQMHIGEGVASTSSFREMNESAYETESELKGLLEHILEGTNHDGQVGMLVMYKGQVLGVEVYGSNKLWMTFRNAALRGFLIDQYFMKDEDGKQLTPEDALSIISHEFKSTGLAKENATGSGDLYRFSDDSWQGVFIHLDGVPIHLYAAKRHVDPLEGRPTRQEQIGLDGDLPWREYQRGFVTGLEEELEDTPAPDVR